MEVPAVCLLSPPFSGYGMNTASFSGSIPSGGRDSHAKKYSLHICKGQSPTFLGTQTVQLSNITILRPVWRSPEQSARWHVASTMQQRTRCFTRRQACELLLDGAGGQMYELVYTKLLRFTTLRTGDFNVSSSLKSIPLFGDVL